MIAITYDCTNKFLKRSPCGNSDDEDTRRQDGRSADHERCGATGRRFGNDRVAGAERRQPCFQGNARADHASHQRTWLCPRPVGRQPFVAAHRLCRRDHSLDQQFEFFRHRARHHRCAGGNRPATTAWLHRLFGGAGGRADRGDAAPTARRHHPDRRRPHGEGPADAGAGRHPCRRDLGQACPADRQGRRLFERRGDGTAGRNFGGQGLPALRLYRRHHGARYARQPAPGGICSRSGKTGTASRSGDLLRRAANLHGTRRAGGRQHAGALAGYAKWLSAFPTFRLLAR